jgi:hypothetical protein
VTNIATWEGPHAPCGSLSARADSARCSAAAAASTSIQPASSRSPSSARRRGSFERSSESAVQSVRPEGLDRFVPGQGAEAVEHEEREQHASLATRELRLDPPTVCRERRRHFLDRGVESEMIEY